MRTGCFTTYHGPGRVMLAKPAGDVPRGYRLAPQPFYLGTKRPSSAAIWSQLALADANAVWRWLHALTQPYEPVLCSASPAGIESYRVLLAEWLSAHTGELITELEDPENHRALKVRPTLHGLRPGIWQEPAAETAPEQV